MSGVQHESVPDPRGGADPAAGPGSSVTGRDAGDGPDGLAARVVELEHEIANLEAALETRTRIGTAIGLLAERHDTTTAQAWSLLTRLSNHTNSKVQEVARLLVDVTDGNLDADDVEAVGQLARSLPRAVAAIGLDRDRPTPRRRRGSTPRTRLVAGPQRPTGGTAGPAEPTTGPDGTR